jgi:hypothetical protein
MYTHTHTSTPSHPFTHTNIPKHEHRPHGGEGTFVALTHAPIGYNQLSVALDLIDDPSCLDRLPVIPAPLKVRVLHETYIIMCI